jgi:hypothetical protein
MNIRKKPMILIFENNGSTWSRILKDQRGNILYEFRNQLLLPEHMNAEYFDNWENQMRKVPQFNIVDCIRFM